MKKICLGVIAAAAVAAASFAQAQTTVIVEQQPMVKVTLKINEPRSLMRHQKASGMPNTVTLGEKSFKLPPGVEQVTVTHPMGNMGMQGKPISMRIAFNGSTCKTVEIYGRPMQHPNRMITLYVSEARMANGMVTGYCDKAVISGSR